MKMKLACWGCGYYELLEVRPNELLRCPKCGQVLKDHANPEMSAKQVYNLATDIGAGPNLRWKDNLYQGLFILACIPIAAGIGYFVTPGKLEGPIFGGGIGLLVGLFASGAFLMVYRAVQHARRKHD